MMTVGILWGITFWYTQEQEDAYQWARAREITTTNSIEQADMGGSLTRIAMAKMISQYAINILEKTPDLSQDCQFADVDPQLDESYNRGVTLSCQLGLMGKGGKFFNPHKTVTRAELGTVLSRLLYGLEDGNPYYFPHLGKLKDEEIIKNDDPILKEQRGYFMLMLMRSQGKEYKITSSEQALQVMLKELNMEEERKNMEMTSCTFWNDTFDRYYCSFIYQNKSFISWIKASNGTFIPLTIIKDGSGWQTDDKNGKKVIIQNVISSQQQEEEIKNLVERYYHFDAKNRGVWTLGGVDTNTLIVYADDERELYMDRETKSKINSSENLLSLLEKNSGVPKDIIADQSNYNYIHHRKWDYGENNEILFVYNFKYHGIEYEYKINPLNGEIRESNKREKTKFITLDDIEDQWYHFTDITKETSGGNIITFELADKIEYRGEDIILWEYTVHQDIIPEDDRDFTDFRIDVAGRKSYGPVEQNPGRVINSINSDGQRQRGLNEILSGKYLALLHPYHIQEGVEITISAINRLKWDEAQRFDTVSFKVSEIPNPVKTETLTTLEGDGYIFSDVTIKKDPYSTVNFQLENPQDTGDFVYLGKVTLSEDANGVASNGFYVDKKLLWNANFMSLSKGTYPIYISKKDLLKGKEYKIHFHGYTSSIDSDEVSFTITKLPPSGIIHRAVITDGMGERTFLGKADYNYENHSDNILLYPALKFISNNDDFDERVPEVLKKLQITSENKSFSRKVEGTPSSITSWNYEEGYRWVSISQREEWIPLEIESNDEIDPLKITLHYEGKEIPIQYTKDKCLVLWCWGFERDEY